MHGCLLPCIAVSRREIYSGYTPAKCSLRGMEGLSKLGGAARRAVRRAAPPNFDRELENHLGCHSLNRYPHHQPALHPEKPPCPSPPPSTSSTTPPTAATITNNWSM